MVAIRGGNKSVKDLPWRKATAAEYGRMQGWLKWSYDHGQPVVLFLDDNAMLLVNDGYSRLDETKVEVLQKEA